MMNGVAPASAMRATTVRSTSAIRSMPRLPAVMATRIPGDTAPITGSSEARTAASASSISSWSKRCRTRAQRGKPAGMNSGSRRAGAVPSLRVGSFARDMRASCRIPSIPSIAPRSGARPTSARSAAGRWSAWFASSLGGVRIGSHGGRPAWNDPAMPDLTSQLSSGVTWASSNALHLAFWALVLFVAYRVARPWIHRLLVRMMHARPLADGDVAEQEETNRRLATIEDLVTKVLRTLVVVALVAVVLGLLDLWSLVAGLGLVIAALTLAGQSIILDLLMGILILVEGQYFKGDTVQFGGVEGTVEEVGLRRTVIRDVRGTVHSISNGTIRQSANLTRTYAAATIEIDGVADRDVEAVIEVLDDVGRALADDAGFAGLFHDVPGYSGTTRLASTGATIRMSGRVRPEARARIEQEMRRRVAAALAAKGVELIRPGGYAQR